MYVITGPMQEGNPFYLTWRELHRMRDSGRWDIQPHAADGHREIVTDPDGTMAPFYANRRFTRSTGLETFPAYTQRVASDIYELQDDFRRQDIPSETFAVPFGDHGQNAKDPRIPRFLDDLLATLQPHLDDEETDVVPLAAQVYINTALVAGEPDEHLLALPAVQRVALEDPDGILQDLPADALLVLLPIGSCERRPETL